MKNMQSWNLQLRASYANLNEQRAVSSNELCTLMLLQYTREKLNWMRKDQKRPLISKHAILQICRVDTLILISHLYDKIGFDNS